MDKFAQLVQDMGTLLDKYGATYLRGIGNTLLLAVIATAIGCLIGLVCGILQTIPHTKNDKVFKRFFLALSRIIPRNVESFATPYLQRFILRGHYLQNNAVALEQHTHRSVINTGVICPIRSRASVFTPPDEAQKPSHDHFQTSESVILPQAVQTHAQFRNNFIINVKDNSVMVRHRLRNFSPPIRASRREKYKFFPHK